MALKPKMARFVEEYLVDLDGAKAAIRAGYSARTAKEQAYRLLNRPDVQKAVEAGKASLADRSDVTAEEVIRGFTRIARANMKTYARWGTGTLSLTDSDELTEDEAAAISEVSIDKDGRVKVKLRDSKSAWDSLARHFGLNKDSLQVDATDDLKEFLNRVSDRGRTKAG